jgi:hypothetical protein
VSRAGLDQIAFKVVSSVMGVTCTSTALVAKKKKGETAPLVRGNTAVQKRTRESPFARDERSASLVLEPPARGTTIQERRCPSRAQ